MVTFWGKFKRLTFKVKTAVAIFGLLFEKFGLHLIQTTGHAAFN